MLKAARLSTVRFLREVASEILAADGVGLSYVDWDDHADMNKLPMTDIYGLTGMGITENDKTHEVVFGVTLSTYNDQNLFRMTDMSDLFYRRLRAGTTFSIYDPVTGLEVGKMVFQTGTSAMPVNRVETRAVVSISVTGLLVMNAEFAANN